MNSKTLIDSILKLPATERLELVEQIMRSLDRPDQWALLQARRFAPCKSVSRLASGWLNPSWRVNLAESAPPRARSIA